LEEMRVAYRDEKEEERKMREFEEWETSDKFSEEMHV
jgi:hypothetical protein